VQGLDSNPRKAYAMGQAKPGYVKQSVLTL